MNNASLRSTLAIAQRHAAVQQQLIFWRDAYHFWRVAMLAAASANDVPSTRLHRTRMQNAAIELQNAIMDAEALLGRERV